MEIFEKSPILNIFARIDLLKSSCYLLSMLNLGRQLITIQLSY